MELARYVGDRLHDLLGISDKYVAEYFIGLAAKSASASSFIEKLRDTDTVTVDQTMMAFAEELWKKVSHCVLCHFMSNVFELNGDVDKDSALKDKKMQGLAIKCDDITKPEFAYCSFTLQ